MTRVKVCGLTREQDVHAAVDAGADAIGVIVDVPVDTPREVSVDHARNLIAAAPPFVTTVLVTMQNRPGRVIELVDAVDPDAVQLHGDLPSGDVAYVRSKLSARLIRAVSGDDPEAAHRHDAVADTLLLDTPTVDGAGGTGRTHDWERARDLTETLESPVILAGGLTPENVTEAVQTAEPYAVDVASGVEATPGEKDAMKVLSFIERARRALAIA